MVLNCILRAILHCAINIRKMIELDKIGQSVSEARSDQNARIGRDGGPGF